MTPVSAKLVILLLILSPDIEMDRKDKQSIPVLFERPGGAVTVLFNPAGKADNQIAGAMECKCDLDCHDGDSCTVDTCSAGVCSHDQAAASGLPCEDNDGDFCTQGTCDNAGQCVAGMNNPCDTMGGETCDESNDVCVGTECAVDSDCDNLDDAPNCIQGACEAGNCLVESTCTTGESCDGSGACELVTDGRCCSDVDACAATTLAACDSGNGPWSQAWECDCPKYSSLNENDGVEYNVLLTAGETGCASFSRIGDDYAMENGSFLELQQFRFFGGPATTGTGSGVMIFEFWDSAVDPAVLVESFGVSFTGACDGASDNPGDPCADNSECPNGTCDPSAVIRGSYQWTITLASPVVIPPTGFFAVRPGNGSGETVGIVSTNNVGMIGNNNPDQLFWGEGDTGAFLSPDVPDILAFELIGNKVASPFGACCMGEGACDDTANANTPWLCEATGGQFVPGATCLDTPCNEATCCFADGSCLVLESSTCNGAGGTVGIFGETCDPNCCPQPATASNSCGTATPTILDTEDFFEVQVQITGDTSTATNGICSISGTPCRTYQVDGEDCPPGETCDIADPTECVISTQDQGHWESFTITANSHIEIGFCCTDANSPASPGFRWIVLVDDCEECTTISRDADGQPNPDGCDDGQPSDIYSTLPAGTYHYAVFSERYCENSSNAADCVTDDDCEPGTGPCITQTGPYSLTVKARRLAAGICCLGSVCTFLDSIECRAQGGFATFYCGENTFCQCAPINPCLLGACCLGAGTCDDNEGTGINQGDCELNPQGQYIGGALCEDDACPECEIASPDNCQSDPLGPFILAADRALWNPPDEINRWADDFTATNTGALDRICWWPAFFNPGAGAECSGVGETPPDNWELTIYADEGGLPGAVIAPTQSIIPDAKITLGPTSRIWQYSAPIDNQPMLQAGQTYWIEITGEGEGDGGCVTYWAMTEEGNQYLVNDQTGSYGSEDVISDLAGSGHADLAFCVSTGITTPPVPTGACCQSESVCTDGIDAHACNALEGAFRPGEVCSTPDLCPIECEAPTCAKAIDLNAPGEACENGLPCSRPFDTTFCDGETFEAIPLCNVQPGDQGGTDMGGISWYSFTHDGPENGTCTVDACAGGTYDSALAVYKDTCPGSLADFWGENGCGDDTCGIGGGMSTISFPCCSGSTYYIAMGGWQGETGTGTLELSFKAGEAPGCNPVLAPLADERFDINSSTKACTTDMDCKAGETGPDPQTVCRDTTGDGNVDACYVARNRYLSIKANPQMEGISHTYRVSLQTGVAGSIVLGYTGAPDLRKVQLPGPNQFQLTRIDDTPHYRDWTTLSPHYISIADCEVSPDHTYLVQTIVEGSDLDDESKYSSALNLPTVEHWADTTGGGNPGDPPNGATGTLVDVFACIRGFQNTPDVPCDWLDLNPVIPNKVVSLADAFDGVQAFQQGGYPYPAPLECP